MRDRLVRDASLVGLGLLVVQAVRLALAYATWPGFAGADFEIYRQATARWLAGGAFYLPDQLAGRYTLDYGAVLYPPVALWLFAPFTVLPAVIWWAVPAALVTWTLYRLRPAAWTWPVFAAIMLVPHSWQMIVLGNPSMWIVAFGFLGVLYGWPATLILLKPTLAPFALIGVNRRSWWLALGVLALLCLPFPASMWVDWYKAAVVNPANGGLLYSLPYVPVLCTPLVAWAGSKRGAHLLGEWRAKIRPSAEADAARHGNADPGRA